jgi:hypothetical protein
MKYVNLAMQTNLCTLLSCDFVDGCGRVELHRDGAEGKHSSEFMHVHVHYVLLKMKII